MKKDEIKYVWTAKKGTFLGLPLSFTRYFLTETKFITRTGVFSISEDEIDPVSYTHLRAHETPEHLVCRLLLEKKKKTK